jgi:hypothetical protein
LADRLTGRRSHPVEGEAQAVLAGPAQLWVVAGCLFEVSLPEAAGGWRCLPPAPAVTLVGVEPRDGRLHFRFRAESPSASPVEVRFEGDGTTVGVPVRISPEQLAES